MKSLAIILATLCLSIAGAGAQWVTKSYNLAAGWNGIWMSGDASHTTVAKLFEGYPMVTEVWRWNPDPDEIQFTTAPSAPSTNSEEWTVWKKDDPSEQLLTKMVGNSAYLIRTTSTANVSIKQLVQPPAATWLISGANFLGFPSGTPSMSAYLASFPSASTTVLAPGAKIYKYIGGELSAGNPKQVLPNTEIMNAGTAYWFQIPTVSNFTAPIEYEVPSNSGLAFGRTITTMTTGVTNRSTTSVTLTVSVEVSETAPAGQPPVTGAVPLTYRTFNSTKNAYEYKDITAPFSVTVPASGRLNLDFQINRAGMTDSSAFYASVLRIKDAAGLTDVRLPVSAQASTTAGLWVAQVSVNEVGSTIAGQGGRTTSRPFPLVFLMHMDEVGVPRLLSQVFTGQLADTTGNPMGIAVSEKKVLAYSVSDVKPQRYVAAQLPVNATFTGTGSFSTGSKAAWSIDISYKDATNPFVHTYHPDHDNLDASYKIDTGNKGESYTINRNCEFTFTSAPPDGGTVSGWGTSILGGTYVETITGLNHKTLDVSGTFEMRRISEISAIDTTPPPPPAP